ncbi:MAG: hypothetical protein AVDCRST_MAG75-2810 [uncultured Propionibacteriaceae bacterium]|uniref:ANTAR domain-containing protein n=1 Tax=uncultured Propionibacteriaceae bacterium TaxID=257457 RepID=A0A6J4PG67_9ACTN|nr:MAG: hypothetical protein AVDCRST_MAG75-2810 [uncultured Propionibacteriaceae bacterium]
MSDNQHRWPVAETMAKVARTLHSSAPLDDALTSIAVAARDNIPGVDFAGISIVHRRGRIETVAASDPIVYVVDELQYELDEGPCVDAVKGMGFAAVNDLTTDARWPAYAPRAADLGVKSQLGIMLYQEERTLGGLNLYAECVDVLDEDTVQMAQLFAVHAATALGRALAHEQLNQSVATRQVIGQAIGIVMERYKLNDSGAFAFLVRVSQDGNIKLRDLAADLVGETARRHSASNQRDSAEPDLHISREAREVS